MLWRAVRGGGDAILSVRVYAGVHALHIGSERCLKYRRDADAARAGESDDLVSFGAREANREGVQMTTRHGDRFKIAGGKHIKTHVPASRKMQFSLPLGNIVRRARSRS
jgi:hypothetical protein